MFHNLHASHVADRNAEQDHKEQRVQENGARVRVARGPVVRALLASGADVGQGSVRGRVIAIVRHAGHGRRDELEAATLRATGERHEETRGEEDIETKSANRRRSK